MNEITLRVTPTELAFLAAALNDKIVSLDKASDRLRIERERLGLWDDEGEQTNLVVTMFYTGLVRRIEQALDVPFMDQDEAFQLMVESGAVAVLG